MWPVISHENLSNNMAKLLSRTFSSPVVKLVVGSESKEYFVHRELIESSSKVFKNAFTNNMKESISQTIKIDDFEADTVEKFLEYIYKGQYEFEDGVERVGSEDQEVKFESFDINTDSNAWQHFEGFICDGIVRPDSEVPENDHNMIDFTQAFLCHVKLYVFADKYDVEGLATETSTQLHHVLSKFKLFETSIGDFVNLIEYVYDNITKYWYVDKMKDVICSYSISIMAHLVENKRFVELLNSRPDLERDLILTTAEVSKTRIYNHNG